VIGGGDGGCLREVCRHESVESVTLCEIDKMVCDVSEKFFPKMSSVFKDKRVNFYFDDGAQYLRDHRDEFDVIIVDSSDPVGPAESLFGEDFFDNCSKSLKKGGILITQAECMWLHIDLIAKMIKYVTKIFANVDYGYTVIPTYPSGTIGFFVCRKEEGSCKVPLRELSTKEKELVQYYSKEIHSAAFVLPVFAQRKLTQALLEK
jgi:spermidine synthase